MDQLVDTNNQHRGLGIKNIQHFLNHSAQRTLIFTNNFFTFQYLLLLWASQQLVRGKLCLEYY